MKKLLVCLAGLTLVLTGAISTANAALNVAIVKGSWYTPDLNQNLTGAGVNVTEITTYTAASLASFDSVIVYGNAFTDMTALTTYVQNGGTLVETPWFWFNYSPPSQLQVLTNGGGTVYSQSYPGINVLDAGNPLLAGVTFPGGTGGFNIGRTTGNSFTAGATQIAAWGDGTAMIGVKDLGLGKVVAINMHVITSDTAYQVIDQPWATQLFVNAVGANQVQAVPEPSTLIIFGLGGLGLAAGAARRRRKFVA